MYCNYVLKRLWEDDLQLDQKIKELKKTRKELRFDLNSAAEYMCFCKAILPDSEEYGLIDRDSFLGIRLVICITMTLNRPSIFLKTTRIS